MSFRLKDCRAPELEVTTLLIKIKGCKQAAHNRDFPFQGDKSYLTSRHIGHLLLLVDLRTFVDRKNTVAAVTVRRFPNSSENRGKVLNLGLGLDARRERGTAADRLLFGGKCEERGEGILLAALAVRDVQGVGGQVPGAEEGE